MQKPGLTYQNAIGLVCNQPKSFIDDYAERTATLLKLEPGGDISTLTTKLGGRIEYVSFFDERAELNTIWVHGPKDFSIVLSELSSVRRDRFTIAHELGHYFLHSQMGMYPMKASRNGSDRAEWEANWFAAGLLMPQKPFRALHGNSKSVSWLADHFGVSEQAAQIRCTTLKLT